MLFVWMAIRILGDAGSINVPFLKAAAGGMLPNEEFMQELSAAGVQKSDVIVLACASGKRAAMAALKLNEEVGGWVGVCVCVRERERESCGERKGGCEECWCRTGLHGRRGDARELSGLEGRGTANRGGVRRGFRGLSFFFGVQQQ